jgi:hypothetical protein
MGLLIMKQTVSRVPASTWQNLTGRSNENQDLAGATAPMVAGAPQARRYERPPAGALRLGDLSR